MKQEPWVKFVHNNDQHDDKSLSLSKGFWVTDMFTKYRPGRFVLESRVLLGESRVFALWKKWQNIRFRPEDKRMNASFYDETPEFLPLGFQTSDVHLAFYAFGYFLGVAGGLLVFEMVVKNVTPLIFVSLVLKRFLKRE